MKNEAQIATAIAVSFLVGVGTHSIGTRNAVEDAKKEGFYEGYSKFAEQVEVPEGQKWEVCGDGKWHFVPKDKKAAC